MTYFKVGDKVKKISSRWDLGYSENEVDGIEFIIQSIRSSCPDYYRCYYGQGYNEWIASSDLELVEDIPPDLQTRSSYINQIEQDLNNLK